MANQSINLNLIPDGIKPIAKVSQFDVGRIITFSLFENGEPYTPPNGTAVEVRGQKNDKKIFVYDESTGYVSRSGSVITLSTSQQMTAAAGEALCQFKLTHNTDVIATLNFWLDIQTDPAANGDISESEIPGIVAEATEQMHRAEAAATAAAADALDAEAFGAGTRGGDPVGPSDPAYQNNAPYYNTQAGTSATSAGLSATAAEDSAEDSEAYAIGKRNGQDVPSTDPAYHNNSKYYSDLASAWAAHPPYVGANGDWYVYNPATQQFEDTGIDASITMEIRDITMLTYGSTPTVTNSGTSTDAIFHLGIPRAAGIQSVTKTGSSGLVDTYRMLFQDGYYFDYQVTNGSGGSGGHTIENESGQNMPARTGLQFIGATVTDDSTNDRTVVTIQPGGTTIVQKPTVVVGSYTYDGTAQGPTITWVTGMADHCIITNATKTDAGTYTLTIALKNSQTMVWNDITTADLTYSYTIDKATLSVPTLSGSFTYDGTEKSCTISGFDSTTMTKSGTEAATNAGTYTVTFALADSDNYEWVSGSLSQTWTIAKADQTITLSTNSVTLDSDHLTASVTVTGAEGAISATTSDNTVATASVSGDIVTISNVNETNGSATITVSVAGTANYNPATDSTVSVTASFATWVDLWLTAGGLSPSSYADLSAVLADEEAVRRLFTIHDSVDYLVTNKTFIGITDLTTLLNDDYVAKWINLRDYALDTLYADSTIAGIMDTADKYFYGEWTITDSTTTPPTWGPNGNVPVMTSNTAPYGTASAYQVFDKNFSTTASGTDFSYQFTNPVCTHKFTCKNTSGVDITGGTLQGSNDGSTWTNISTPLNNTAYYLYHRVHFASSQTVAELQFYGRELRVSVPTMTSNTAPYGEAKASNPYNAITYYGPAYYSFSNGNKTLLSSGDTNNYIQYNFNNKVVIKMVSLTELNNAQAVNPYSLPHNIQFYVSNDDSSWETVGNGTISEAIAGKTYTFNVSNPKQGSIFKMLGLDNHSGASIPVGYMQFGKYLQFYGLDYSEYDWDEDNPRHYLYDHGVEPNEAVSGGTKGDHAITLTAVGTATATVTTTNYTAMGGKVGMRASGTNAFVCGASSSTFSATNMPYGNGIDITNVNGSNAVGVSQTAAGTFDVEEVWIA